jgi:TonB family protein
VKSFQISTADELAGLARLVNNEAGLKQSIDFNGRTIMLAKDIDVSKYCYGSTFNNGNGWIPIGHCGEEDYDYECFEPFEFNGAFDGNDKKISGLYSKHEARGDHEGRLTYIPGGLFGNVAGTVRNLGVVGAKVDGGGGIVGTLSGGGVSNCYFAGTVSNDGIAGGIVGWMKGGSVSNCYFAGTVSGESGTGGIAGYVGLRLRGQGGSILNCYSAGTVSGGAGGTGGIAGAMDGQNSGISNCYSTAAVSGTSSVGGIVGFVNNLTKSKEYIRLRWEFFHEDMGMGNNSYNNDNLSKTYYRRVKAITPFDTLKLYVSNNVALNPNVNATGSSIHIPLITMPDWMVDGLGFDEYRSGDSSFSHGGRVVGGSDAGRFSGNAAFIGIVNKDGNTKWDDRTAKSKNGEDISTSVITSDGTLGGRFTSKNGWTVQKGKLPGFGTAVDMPEYLKSDGAPDQNERNKQNVSASTDDDGVRKGVAGIGYGSGYGSGFGGGGGGIDDLLGGLMSGGGGGLDLKKRGELKAASPDSLTSGAATLLTSVRSRASIQRVVMQNIAELRYSYNRRVRENPGLQQGTITVKFAIDEFGKVISARLVESTMNDPELENTVLTKVKSWIFEKIDKPGDVMEVTYPFAFSQ